MARLRDDCAAADERAVSLDAIGRLIDERFGVAVGAETISVSMADGRVAAANVRASVALPAFDNAAVDGWAVASSDLSLQGETRLPIGGRVAAGGSLAGIEVRQRAVRVFTGAQIPPDADTVFMQEDVQREGDAVVLPAGLARGANVRPRGEDVAGGDVVVPAGRRLRPQDLALLCAVGETRITVRRQLRVALLSTGDEVREPGTPLAAGAIYDANRAMLRALLRRAGAEVDDLGILRDDAQSLRRRLVEASGRHDLLVSSGGVSTGEEDHVKAAVEAEGALDVWRVAIKPGKPVALGHIRQTPFIGLPGNPVAAFVTFAWIVRPLLARLTGATLEPLAGMPVRLAFAHRKRAGIAEFVRVSVSVGGDGMLEAHKFDKAGTGILTSLTHTDGFVALSADDTIIEAGSFAGYHPFSALF